VTLPLESVEVAVLVSRMLCALLYSSMKPLIALFTFSVSLVTVIVTSLSSSAVTFRPAMPDDSSVMTLVWLTSVPPPLTEYKRFFPRSSAPEVRPVAAAKLPVTSSM
jgi:hypothetical protein